MRSSIFSFVLGSLICIANPTLAMLGENEEISGLSSQKKYSHDIEEALKKLNNTNENIRLHLDPKRSNHQIIIFKILDKKDNNELGEINWRFDDQGARLNDIRLKDEYQGKGFGKLSLITFYKLMDLLGIQKTTCCLQSANPYTAKLYLSIGMRFDLNELEELGRCGDYNLFEHFLQNSSGSTNCPMEMFRVGCTPFTDSTPDQRETYFNLLPKNE